MKKRGILSCLLFVLLPVFGQCPGAGGNRPPMKVGHIFGTAVDTEGKPLEFATVIVMQSVADSLTGGLKDILVKADQTTLEGTFDIKELPVNAKLKLLISSVGYKTAETLVAFPMPKMDGFTPPKPGQQPDPAMIAKFMAAFDLNMGEIKLESDDKMLDQVVVTATKALVEMDIDKKIFNVEKNIVTTGGTAVDVMRNIPSVQVDIDGNVKVRNAAPTLFIDGRPTTLSMNQIPADVIEKVEVITNPSAKYDASGSMAGIINIVLKKNRANGINGMVNASADRFGGSNVMTSLNLKQKKVNLSMMGMYMGMRTNVEGNSLRESSIGEVNSVVNQDITSKTIGNMAFGRLGLDYNLTDRTTLSTAGILGFGSFKPEEDIRITSQTNELVSLSNRLSNSTRSFRPQGVQLGFTHNFPSEGEQLTADLNFFGGNNDNSGLFTTNYLSNGQITGNQIQKNEGSGSNSFLTVQTDYTKSFKNGLSLETGLRAQISSLSNLNENFLKPVGSDVYTNITAASMNFDSRNDVYAAYLSMAGKAGDAFSYKLGLRGESSFYDGKLLNSGDSFSNSYPLSLFPSVFLSKNLTQKDQVQFSVTRRVNRPSFFQLIPFIDYSDSLNITRGNADLVPEFTTSGEMSYSHSQGTGIFLASAYYKYTTNLITRYLNEEINPVSGKTDLINTYINANNSVNYGTELTYTNKITKWWDFTANVNLYNSSINLENLESVLQNDPIWTVFGKFNSNFNLPGKWVIQLSADYQGKTNMPVSQGGMGFGGGMSQTQSSSQGYIKPFYGIDLAVKKSFMKNDIASFTLAANDLFRTRGNTQISLGSGFYQEYYRLSNPQLVRATLSIRFGQMDMKSMKKNSMNMEGMQMQ